MKKISARQLTTAAAIAALYTVLSLASSFIPTVGGVFQFRVSEALTILPYFTPAAIPGLFIGCLLSNLITGALPYDLVFGSLATLIGAIGTFALRKLGKNTSRTLPGGMPLVHGLLRCRRLQQTRSSCRLLSQKYLKCRSRFRCSRSPSSSAKLCSAADSGCCCLPH